MNIPDNIDPQRVLAGFFASEAGNFMRPPSRGMPPCPMALRPATYEDCQTLALALRPRDLQEIGLSGTRRPEAVVSSAWLDSKIAEAIVTPEGHLAGIWGVTATPRPDVGAIWMLGTDQLERIQRPFVRACRPSIARAHGLFPTLACAPWRDNTLHLTWLRWLGFLAEDVGHEYFLPHYRHV